MSIQHSFRTLAFRVHLKPAPQTQSESNAILRALLELGPISAFQVPQNGKQHSTVADVVYAYNTRSLDDLRNVRGGRTLTVTANANIPDPHKKDPFNIRGLKNRKPELPSRTFECRVTPAKGQTRLETTTSSKPILNTLKENEYSGPFAVDRSSIFAEILAKTDCPSGLIHGLLPKLKDEHRGLAYGETSGGADSDKDITQQILARTGHEGQKAGRSTEFIPVNLDRKRSQESGTAKINQEEAGKEQDVASPARFHDEFAGIRNFSLMETYRKAIDAQKAAVDKGRS